MLRRRLIQLLSMAGVVSMWPTWLTAKPLTIENIFLVGFPAVIKQERPDWPVQSTFTDVDASISVLWSARDEDLNQTENEKIALVVNLSKNALNSLSTGGKKVVAWQLRRVPTKAPLYAYHFSVKLEAR